MAELGGKRVGVFQSGLAGSGVEKAPLFQPPTPAGLSTATKVNTVASNFSFVQTEANKEVEDVSAAPVFETEPRLSKESNNSLANFSSTVSLCFSDSR